MRVPLPSRPVAALVVALATAVTPAVAETPLARLGWLGEMAGSCWKGSDEQGRTTDRQCYTTQYDRYLRGAIEVHAGSATGKAQYFGDSFFAWDPSRSRIIYYYWASAGHFGSAECYYEGETLVFPPTDEGETGRPKVRSKWTRLDPDVFRVVREKWIEGAWQPQLTAVYRRDGSVERADEDEPIVEILDRYVAEWLGGDAEGVLELFTEDAVLLPHHGLPPVVGKPAIRDFWWPPGGPPARIDRFVMAHRDVTVAGSTAVAWGEQAVAWTTAGRREESRGTHMTVLHEEAHNGGQFAYGVSEPSSNWVGGDRILQLSEQWPDPGRTWSLNWELHVRRAATGRETEGAGR